MWQSILQKGQISELGATTTSGLNKPEPVCWWFVGGWYPSSAELGWRAEGQQCKVLHYYHWKGNFRRVNRKQKAWGCYAMLQHIWRRHAWARYERNVRTAPPHSWKEVRCVFISPAHNPLKAEWLRCRRFHVISHASTQLDFTSASTIITPTVKNKSQTLLVCLPGIHEPLMMMELYSLLGSVPLITLKKTNNTFLALNKTCVHILS